MYIQRTLSISISGFPVLSLYFFCLIFTFIFCLRACVPISIPRYYFASLCTARPPVCYLFSAAGPYSISISSPIHFLCSVVVWRKSDAQRYCVSTCFFPVQASLWLLILWAGRHVWVLWFLLLSNSARHDRGHLSVWHIGSTMFRRRYQLPLSVALITVPFQFYCSPITTTHDNRIQFVVPNFSMHHHHIIGSSWFMCIYFGPSYNTIFISGTYYICHIHTHKHRINRFGETDL
ncbi:hypothetical protein BJ138DRAFT_245791 [Hygrophoropsis aurantiaca]|uniref:Uncharacterized protein n=1 Tax=Hygrophoropsis aurantiaca TaxID=72124 RepID=A0ACB8AQF9_9AGAM|nr:hypothetical protein BJ138DRAFT_245791 [Hygrophoropsis aurantiaca]